MKVYVVNEHYDSILGVYSSRELAEAAIKRSQQINNTESIAGYDVEEFELDSSIFYSTEAGPR